MIVILTENLQAELKSLVRIFPSKLAWFRTAYHPAVGGDQLQVISSQDLQEEEKLKLTKLNQKY
jgi:hypothetical protein